jgi:hypothetical protein
MNRETVQQIVKEDLGMRKISTKMVPHFLLNVEMFDRVITGYEMRCFQYYPETK